MKRECTRTENNMEEKKVTDLLDDFLLGRMKKKDVSKFEEWRCDPRIKNRVKRDMKVFDIIQWMRYQELRKKLKCIDDEWIRNRLGKKPFALSWDIKSAGMKMGFYIHPISILPFLPVAI